MRIRRNFWYVIAALLAFLVLPSDYFRPTAEIFREAGAKPLSLYLISTVLVGFIARMSITSRMASLKGRTGIGLLLLFLGTILNFFSLELHGVEKVAHIDGNYTPYGQFIRQAAMFWFLLLSLAASAIFWSQIIRRVRLGYVITVTTLIHLLLYLYEALSPDGMHSIAAWFKTDLGIGRASGLTTEPSYWGVYSACMIFCLSKLQMHRFFKLGLIGLLALSAILSNSKTFYLIFFCLSAWAIVSATRHTRLKSLAIFSAIGLPALAYAAIALGAATPADNMSSLQRFGGSVVALNVWLNSLPVFGIGFGQFNFFYDPSMGLPGYDATPEAINLFKFDGLTRASTYNLYIRSLLEGGLPLLLLMVAGILFALLRVYRLQSHSDYAIRQNAGIAGILIGSGAAFWLTQDSFSNSYIALGMGLVIAVSDRARRVCRA